MDWLGPVLTALIGKLDPVSLILLVMMIGCAWYHVIVNRENRADRQQFMELLQKNNEVVNMLKNVISAALGKPL